MDGRISSPPPPDPHEKSEVKQSSGTFLPEVLVAIGFVLLCLPALFLNTQ